MQTGEDDCSWEDIYRYCGVRCDIDDQSSPGEQGVCPTPLANPFYIASAKLERWMEQNGLSLNAYA